MLNNNIKYTDVNIGDEIICIDNSGSEKLIIDKKYIVLDIETNLNWITTICEDGDKCQPEGNPAYEIALFGPSHVVKSWNIDYLKLYKLDHSK